jgi:hypothetical protein
MPCLEFPYRTTLAGISQSNGGLCRAYLLKEQLRQVFACRDVGTARTLPVLRPPIPTYGC